MSPASPERTDKDEDGLRALAWPIGQLADGLAELGRRAGFTPSAIDPGLLPHEIDAQAPGEIDRFMAWLADAEGMTADAVESPASEVEAMLLATAPAVLRLPGSQQACFILMLRCTGRSITVVTPGGNLARVSAAALAEAMLAPHERPLRHEVRRVLSLMPTDSAGHEARTSAIARARLGTRAIGGVWRIGLSGSAPLAATLRHHRLHWLAIGLLVTFALSYVMEIAGWRLMGETVLSGEAGQGWLLAWALLLVTAVPVRFWGARQNARLTVSLSALIKQRLLAGALNIDTAELRQSGAGQILAQVLETQAFEQLAVNGGFMAVIALIEIGIAFYILSFSTAAVFLVALLGVWLVLIAVLGLRYFATLTQWSGQRLALTHDMVDRMVGHRTVLAQEPAERRAHKTDLALNQYHLSARRLDHAVMPFLASLPAGWTIAALAVLSPSFIAGQLTAAGLAISIGGILFAGRAINTICNGLAGLARAAVAWRKAAPVFRAAQHAKRTSPFIPARTRSAGAGGGPVIEARDLVFRHAEGARTVLRGASLTLSEGDRILLEGPSGGGKSTLASLLSGLRAPDSGLVLLDGLDRHTLGTAWHSMATAAPQFHENHIMCGPLAYNLLMGRRWPAAEADLVEARAVCDELGLGPLIDRMPAGLMQQVGESGWQLSHGEKSRIFLARALLQDAALTILDESFAALDPETLKRALACASRRARALLVIAHV